MPSPSATAPAANLTSGQFINVEKHAFVKIMDFKTGVEE